MLRTAMSVAVKWQVLARSPMRRRGATEDTAQGDADARRGAGAPLPCRCRWGRREVALLLHDAAAYRLPTGRVAGATVGGSRPGHRHHARQRHCQRLPGQGIVVGSTKTATGRRPITLGADVVALLHRHRAEQTASASDGSSVGGQRPGVPQRSGRLPGSQGRARLTFLRICRRAEVPAIRPYDLRHTTLPCSWPTALTSRPSASDWAMPMPRSCSRPTATRCRGRKRQRHRPWTGYSGQRASESVTISSPRRKRPPRHRPFPQATAANPQA